MFDAGEIITLTLGSVGALSAIPYWNSTTGEDQLRTVLYRQRTRGPPQPRFIAIEGGGFHTAMKIKKETRLTDEGPASEEALSAGEEQSPVEPQPQERPWFRYIGTELHPRTILSVKCQEDEISCYGQGSLYYEANRETILDTVRFFLEECDRAQGIQCIAESTTLFGAFLPKLSEHIKDEFGSLPILLHGALMSPPDPPPHPLQTEETSLAPEGEDPPNTEHTRFTHQYDLNRLVASVHLNDSADLYFPFEMTGRSFDVVPALLAASMDVTWDCCRVEKEASRFHTVKQLLRYTTLTGTLAHHLAYPLPPCLSKQPHLDFPKFFRHSGVVEWGKPTLTFSHLWSSRGVGGLSQEELYGALAACDLRTSRQVIHLSPKPYSLSASTPSALLGAPEGTQLPDTVPVATYASCGSGLAVHFDSIRGAVLPLRSAVVAGAFPEYGLEGDEWKELYEGITVLVDEYDREGALKNSDDDGLDD